MRVDVLRVLVLPVAPEAAWRTLHAPGGLAGLIPDLEEAFEDADGTLHFSARLGRRRRSWRGTTAAVEPGRRWEIASGTRGVPFQLAVRIQPHGQGSEIRVAMSLEPPPAWVAPRAAAPSRKGSLQRLLLSTALFSVSAAGLIWLPRLALAGALSALAWGLLGALFLAAISTLSGAHRRQGWPTLASPARGRPLVPEGGRS